MDWHVVVEKVVSAAIGGFNLPRTVLLGLLAGIHDEIGPRYQQLRGRRDEADPDCFLVPIRIAADDLWHLFAVVVNDTRATNYLFIESIAYRTRPMS